MIRVLVVEDSITVRRHVVDALAAEADLRVVGEAADGRRAIELCRTLRPDVVTLDMVLPGTSGLAATEEIMAFSPTPIVIVSSSSNRGEAVTTFAALAAGAVDVLDKPLGHEIDGAWEAALVRTVRRAARIKVITHPRARLRHGAGVPAASDPAPARTRARGGAPALVAIGTSTGGPAALIEVLRGLGPDFPLPILLVNHIAASFGTAFAEWLAGQSPIPVAPARDGEPLPHAGAGRVLVAPPDRHLVVDGGRLALTAAPERHSCRPSVDVLFHSVAAELGARAVACLLTGMGKDGAEGLLAVRRAGGMTIAQDEATSVVFGMPREAIEIGAAIEVLPLGAVAPALRALAAEGAGGLA